MVGWGETTNRILNWNMCLLKNPCSRYTSMIDQSDGAARLAADAQPIGLPSGGFYTIQRGAVVVCGNSRV